MRTVPGGQDDNAARQPKFSMRSKRECRCDPSSASWLFGPYLLVFFVAVDGVSAADREEEEKLSAVTRDVVAIRSIRKAVGRSMVDEIDMMSDASK